MAVSLYSELGPPLGRPLVSPRLERLLIDPEGERAPADQGVVVLLPVADAVGGLRGGLASGHRGCGSLGVAGIRVWPIVPVYQSSLGRRNPSCNNAADQEKKFQDRMITSLAHMRRPAGFPSPAHGRTKSTDIYRRKAHGSSRNLVVRPGHESCPEAGPLIVLNPLAACDLRSPESAPGVLLQVGPPG